MENNSYSATELGIKVERFINKNKILIIATVLVIVAYFVGNAVYTKIKENDRNHANEIYTKLLKEKDEKALNELKTLNPNLYLAILLNDKYAKELAEFKPNKEDALLLDIYNARTSQSKYFLKELKTIENAFEMLKSNKINEAKVLLDSITSDSAFYKIANNLKHYQGNK